MNYQHSVVKHEPYGEAISSLHRIVYPQQLLNNYKNTKCLSMNELFLLCWRRKNSCVQYQALLDGVGNLLPGVPTIGGMEQLRTIAVYVRCCNNPASARISKAHVCHIAGISDSILFPYRPQRIPTL